ncbi:hypothetical protein FHR91_000541 [Erythrobacter lutimaris]|nr:hypothetical protein [Alteriqipengyuania lutimaris]
MTEATTLIEVPGFRAPGQSHSPPFSFEARSGVV